MAAADAHARLGVLPVPGYEAIFRLFSNHVVVEQAFTGDGRADAALLINAIRRGRAFTVVDALATPGGLEFTATRGDQVAQMGDALVQGGDVGLSARVVGPPGTTIVMLRNGLRVGETAASGLVVNTHGEAGVYRVEAHVPGAPGSPPVPWMLSNPIYLGLPRDSAVVPRPSLPLSRIPGRTAEVTVEMGTRDLSELVEPHIEGGRQRRLAGEPPIGWRFQLSNGVAAGQFAAVQVPTVGGLADFDRVRFTAKSGAPVRVWVQLRAVGKLERWGRTFYADAETRLIDLPLRSFTPIGATSIEQPPLDRMDSLLFVVDTLNSRPGASGIVTLAEVVFVR